MSKIIYVVNKSDLNEHDIDKIKNICDDINPDNIIPSETKTYFNGNILYGISNPVNTIKINDRNVLMGHALAQEMANWNDFDSSPPDGNYVIFRAIDSAVEIITDILATRSLWYYFDDKKLIASTSQRAIIQYLGDFKFNKNTIPWVLANGLLGPGMSWDSRLSIMPPDSILKLDIEKWEIGITSTKLRFNPNNKNLNENIAELENRIYNDFSKLKLNYSHWTLTLSGGYDSRGLICMLPRKDNLGTKLNTVTWGLKESKSIKTGDAYLAARIAAKLELDHNYYSTNFSTESLDIILDRFLKNGEGRIDHIGGYMDGFEIWRELFETGIKGVIRGDEVFGSYNFISERHLKSFMGLGILSDFDNLKDIEYLMDIDPKVPDEYIKKSTETFEAWRDRIYQSYLIPNFLAAIADLKFGYVEQINPFISRNIVTCIRSMPDNTRTDKVAFKNIVDKLNPNIDYAKSSSTSSLMNIIKDEKFLNLIHKELKSDLANTIFPSSFLNMLITHIRQEVASIGFFTRIMNNIKIYIPKALKRRILKVSSKRNLDFYLLAYRVFIIVKMNKVFNSDALKHS